MNYIEKYADPKWVFNEVKQATQPIDDYLKFVRDNFNTNKTDFSDIIAQLDEYSQSSLVFSRMQRAEFERIKMARKLRKELRNIPILEDFDKYKKFNKLGNFNLDDKGLKEAYNLSEEIIQDIIEARNWIESYKAFEKLNNQLNNQVGAANNEYLREQLTMLGKSILGLAVELTPMKTGNLRRSGVLLEFDDYIIIAFTMNYAMYVHENTNLKYDHPVHPSNPNCGGEAKFLEKAVQRFFPEAQVIVNHLNLGAVAVKITVADMIRRAQGGN